LNLLFEYDEIDLIPSDLNMMNIDLIPVNSQHIVKDWRVIALCNVLYKLISKVLANRLKVVIS